MDQIPAGEAERAMKVQEVILQAVAKKISWWQAAEILGISERTRRLSTKLCLGDGLTPRLRIETETSR